MKGVLLVLLGIVLGGVIGFFVFTGIGAGIGVATGLKAGACLTVEAAKDSNFITAEQVDEVLNAAIRQIATDGLADETALTGGDAECAKVVEEFKQAASGS